MGCAGQSLPLSAPRVDSKPPPRRPDAVVLDPEPELPQAGVRTEASGVVVLRERVRRAVVVDVVERLLDALRVDPPRDALRAVLALYTSDGRSASEESWRQRLQSHDFTRLVGFELVRPESIEFWEYDELGAGDGPTRPPEMQLGDVLVRAPFELTYSGGEQLFEEALVMILRREEGALRIAVYRETGTS
jgi:hypothetical protein